MQLVGFDLGGDLVGRHAGDHMLVCSLVHQLEVVLLTDNLQLVLGGIEVISLAFVFDL